jgi:phenylacetate-CoA ligase
MASIFLEKSDQDSLVSSLNELLHYMSENFSSYHEFFHKSDGLQIECLEDLIKFPVLDKKEPLAQSLAQEVLARNPLAYFETSGTSGSPFPVIPDFAVERSKEFADFMSEWLDLETNSIQRAVIALPFEMNPIGLKYFLALNQLNIMSIPVGVRTHLCPPRKVLDIFERLQPELLIARPMESLRYAEAMQAQGIDSRKSSIKKVILTGEIVSKSKFKRISRVYGGADVYCVYGLTELDSGGMVSCRKHQYHLPSKPYLAVELLKDDFSTAVMEDGGIGQIVLTNTHKNHMPLFRYKTGDYGVLQKTCDCGQFTTPVINLLGRSSDKIVCAGKMVFPIQIEDILFGYEQIASDYQIIKAGDELSLRLEWLSDDYETQSINQFIENLKSQLFEKLGVQIKNITIFEPGKLVNKLGIAKSKAGTLCDLDNAGIGENKEQVLQLNYSCCEVL